MSRRLIFILVIGAIALAWAWIDGPLARQRRGMEAAHVLEMQLKPRLASDPRFRAVRVVVTTGPALHVGGKVPDEKALQDLNTMVVLPPDAPYRLVFGVKVDAAATQPGN